MVGRNCRRNCAVKTKIIPSSNPTSKVKSQCQSHQRRLQTFRVLQMVKRVHPVYPQGGTAPCRLRAGSVPARRARSDGWLLFFCHRFVCHLKIYPLFFHFVLSVFFLPFHVFKIFLHNITTTLSSSLPHQHQTPNDRSHLGCRDCATAHEQTEGTRSRQQRWRWRHHHYCHHPWLKPLCNLYTFAV